MRRIGSGDNPPVWGLDPDTKHPAATLRLIRSPRERAAELAAYRLSEAFGFDLVPATVERNATFEDGRTEVFIAVEHKGNKFENLQWIMWRDGLADERALASWLDKRPALRGWIHSLAAFDWLIHNLRRLPSSILVDEDEEPDRLWAIDHALAFSDRDPQEESREFAGRMGWGGDLHPLLSGQPVHERAVRLVRGVEEEAARGLLSIGSGLSGRQVDAFLARLAAFKLWLQKDGNAERGALTWL